MRQAGNPSSVDKLRIREMNVFKRTIWGKSPARRIAAERQAVKKNFFLPNHQFSQSDILVLSQSKF